MPSTKSRGRLWLWIPKSKSSREVIAGVLGMTPADIAQLGIEGVIGV